MGILLRVISRVAYKFDPTDFLSQMSLHDAIDFALSLVGGK